MDKKVLQFEFPFGWKWVKLGDVSEPIKYGFTASADFSIDYPKLLRITDIQHGNVVWEQVPGCVIEKKLIKKYLLINGDIVVARTGATTGKSFLIKEPEQSIYASYLLLIRPKDIVFSKYLYFYLKSKGYWNQIADNKRGGAQPNVNAQVLSKTQVPLPPLEEQKRIAAILGEKLEAVEAARSAAEKQLEEVKSLKLTYLKQIFPSKGEELPDGWNWTKLKNVCITSIKNRKPGSDDEYEYSYIDISSIDNEKKNITQSKHILGKEAPSRAKQIVNTNDVIVATTRPNLNAVTIINEEYDGQICSTGFCVLRPSKKINPMFLFFFVQSKSFVNVVSESVKGALYPALNDKKVFEVEIPLPSINEQEIVIQELVEKISNINNVERLVREQLEQIDLLPQAYLGQAFRGEL